MAETQIHSHAFSDEIRYGISQATIRNWEKLNSQTSERLTSRANKRKSKKRVLPVEYISNKDNILFVQNTLDYMDQNNLDILSVILSLGICLLRKKNLLNKRHVISVLSEYANISVVDELTIAEVPEDEFDILGLIYQSYLQEGEKNTIGSYYTPQVVAYNITKDFDLSDGKLFLDPCCGSGAFLLTVAANNPDCLYGVDNDEIAVLIAKINLLLKYNNCEFTPQVYCLDYLKGYSLLQQNTFFNKKYNYIATNPPWGAMDYTCRLIHPLSSKETFSCFFIKAYEQLEEDGTIRFLFPQSILNVKLHRDIRSFILDTAGLVSITTYDDMFSGVTTKFVDIKCGKGANSENFMICSGNSTRVVDISTVYTTENKIFNLLFDEDISILRIVRNRGKYSLQNSIWALGIVTGNNKEILSPECLEGMEKIYTGKEISPFVLSPAKKYIRYNRNKLQQVAKEEIYRATEKLVYKFISNKLVFAYDDSASLFLNSANILIPAIPSMSTKTVLAFLNSSLFQFVYNKLFGELKILKGNLNELLFPEISEKQNIEISGMVDKILNGNRAIQKAIDSYIFNIYGLTDEQTTYIRNTVYGKAD